MSLPAQSTDRFVGRQHELRRIDRLIQAARAGHGGALVLRGEAGIGKTTLLNEVRKLADDARLIEACGAQFEAELPFALLNQLCNSVLSYLPEVPSWQRKALQAVLGVRPGTPDGFRVGLATLDLLTTVAHDTPVICVIDDAQWMDAASLAALMFVARRISAEPVALFFAVRVPCAASDLDTLPGIAVDGLSDADARALLAKLHVTLDEQVRDRIIAEARGNPLALRELPRAGGFAPPDDTPIPQRIEQGFRSRLADLSEDARMLLTVASAEPTGDPALLWAAARTIGLDMAETSEAAAGTGLVDFANRVQFCHPLARSAVYRAAEPRQRRSAHRALAAVTDPEVDPDRRAWHRAQSSVGPDDDIALELDRCASRAQGRGGVAAAAAFLERAAALSLDPVARATRVLAAVQAHLDAGATDTASRLLTTIEHAALDELQRAQLDVLRGRIAFLRHNDAQGPSFMLRAARRLATIDPIRSRETFLDALDMGLVVGRVKGVMDAVVAEARASAPPAPRPDLLDALVLLNTKGHRAAVPLIQSLLHDGDEPMWVRRPGLAGRLACELWDPDTHATIVDWVMRTGRESGSPLLLRLGLAQTAAAAALSGDIGGALVAVAEEEAIAGAMGGPPILYARLYLAGVQGRRREALTLFEQATAVASQSGAGQLIANVHWSSAVLHNGLADYPAALAAAEKAYALGDLFLAGAALPELVEAALRCGRPGAAADALAALRERTEASGTASGLGITAYARGLVTGAEAHFQEAIAYLEQTPLHFYRARAHLLYGEWLRRQGRRRDCRPHLNVAFQVFTEAGVEAFAARAGTELRATGDTAHRRAGQTPDRLTAHELAIARLVATGATSGEVAARLFVSPRTVDAHLRKIFRKLGITSRRQLRDHSELRLPDRAESTDQEQDAG
jgi:DNA-binding CsgD family transcriptional regulator